MFLLLSEHFKRMKCLLCVGFLINSFVQAYKIWEPKTIMSVFNFFVPKIKPFSSSLFSVLLQFVVIWAQFPAARSYQHFSQLSQTTVSWVLLTALWTVLWTTLWTILCSVLFLSLCPIRQHGDWLAGKFNSFDAKFYSSVNIMLTTETKSSDGRLIN